MSMMMASLVSGLISWVLELVSTVFPCCLARFRQLYRVCSAMFSSRASCAMLMSVGDKSLSSMACLRSALYCAMVVSFDPYWVVWVGVTTILTEGVIDASNLGKKIKEGKNQKTVLSDDEEAQICHTFTAKQAVEDFSVVVSYDDIKAKNYSLSAGQYFDVKIDYIDITADEFKAKMTEFSNTLDSLFKQSHELEGRIAGQMKILKFN